MVTLKRVENRGVFCLVGSPILNTEEYKKSQATIELLSKLIEAENRIKTNNDWMTEEQVQETLGV